MNDDLNTQQISDALANEAGRIDVDSVPVGAIVKRGRTRQRRRTAVVSTAVVAGIAFTGVGVRSLSGRGGDQLQVASPSVAHTTVATSALATWPDGAAPPGLEDQDATAAVDGDLGGGSFGEAQPDVYPFRDGFLLVEWPSDTATIAQPTRGPVVSGSLVFRYATDDLDTAEEIGTFALPDSINESDFAFPLIEVANDQVLVAVPADGAFSLSVSSDLQTWSTTMVEIEAAENVAGLEGVVDVEYVPAFAAVVGDRWVLGVEQFPVPNPEALARVAPDVDPSDVFVSFDGFEIIADDVTVGEEDAVDVGSEVGSVGPEEPLATTAIEEGDHGEYDIITAEELGVERAAFEALFEQSSLDLYAGDLATGVGQPMDFGPNLPSRARAPEFVVHVGDVLLGFAYGGGSAWLSTDAQGWRAFDSDIGFLEGAAAIDGEPVVLLRSGDNGVEVRRIAADGTLATVGTGTCPPDTPFVNLWPQLGVLVMACTDDESLAGGALDDEFVMETTQYEITFSNTFIEASSADAGVDADATLPTETYTVRDRETGEILAENTVPSDIWGDEDEMYEVIDGEKVVVFSDRNGRPDVLVPFVELSSQAESDSPVDGSEFPKTALLGSVDGVTWSPLGDTGPDDFERHVIAQNGSSFVVEGFSVNDDGVRREIVQLP